MLEQEISAIIKANLPAQVGEELQKLLAEGKADKKLAEERKKFIDSQDSVIASLRIERDKYIASYNGYVEQEQNLILREQAVTNIEHRIELMNKDVECSRQLVENNNEILGLVFRSPVYIKNVSESINEPLIFQPTPGQGGSPYPTGSTVTKFKNTTETTRED